MARRRGRIAVAAAALSAAAVIAATSPAASAAPAEPPNEWQLIEEEATGSRVGASLVFVGPAGKAVLFGGRLVGDVPYAQVFDPARQTWGALSDERPKVDRRVLSFGYAVAHAPGPNRTFVLCRRRLLSFDPDRGKWRDHGTDDLLKAVAPDAMACDPVGRRLVVVGPGTAPGDVGWTVTLAYDIAAGKWRRLTFGDEEARAAHAARVAAIDAVADVVGRARFAWFRDPEGKGTGDERKDLASRCDALGGMAALEAHRGRVQNIARLIAQQKTHAALKAARELHRRLERQAEAQSPVPPARCRSPLVCDPKSKAMVLFGGDHQDYLTNDTWVLDLQRLAWRRAAPKAAPRPRAGHALVYLPKCGRIALWDGYRQTNNSDYRSWQAGPLDHRELWLYDVRADRWELLRAWPTRRKDKTLPVLVGFADDYGRYAPPALAADEGDRLILSTRGAKVHSKRQYGHNYYSATWMLRVDAAQGPAQPAAKLAAAPNQRAERTGVFAAAFCEQAVEPGKADLDAVAANVWTPLPAVPRNPCRGQRQRDWGTATWDADHDQVLYWGGGHCDGASSPVVHYAPASHRMAEGYDADEQYGHQGSGGTTILGRPWVPTHSYHVYAYDPKCRLMLAAKEVTHLYDPVRMDWLRQTVAQPFHGHCYTAVLLSTPHGVVAWAPRSAGRERWGLWLFDRRTGWADLQPEGSVPKSVVDGCAGCYDSKRDRLLLAASPGYNQPTKGELHAFDFRTRKVSRIVPDAAAHGRLKGFREMAYVAHCDWALVLSPLGVGGRVYTRAYDCATDRWLLLDLGEPVKQFARLGVGAMVCDAGRKLVFVITSRGRLWTLRLDPKTVRKGAAPAPAAG